MRLSNLTLITICACAFVNFCVAGSLVLHDMGNWGYFLALGILCLVGAGMEGEEVRKQEK